MATLVHYRGADVPSGEEHGGLCDRGRRGQMRLENVLFNVNMTPTDCIK